MSNTTELIKTRRNEEWREALRKQTKVKDRLATERVQMPALDGHYRARNHEEVNQGLTPQMAEREASRCIDCPDPTCMTGCPVSIHIPSFIKNIERGEYLQAAQLIRETSSLPGVCGRVCPQEKQCEANCFYTVKMKRPDPVAIGYLERFVADYEREHTSAQATEPTPEPNGIKVAVVGSGPAGLSCAGDLAKLGYQVTVFEALHELGACCATVYQSSAYPTPLWTLK